MILSTSVRFDVKPKQVALALMSKGPKRKLWTVHSNSNGLSTESQV